MLNAFSFLIRGFFVLVVVVVFHLLVASSLKVLHQEGMHGDWLGLAVC